MFDKCLISQTNHESLVCFMILAKCGHSYNNAPPIAHNVCVYKDKQHLSVHGAAPQLVWASPFSLHQILQLSYKNLREKSFITVKKDSAKHCQLVQIII